MIFRKSSDALDTVVRPQSDYSLSWPLIKHHFREAGVRGVVEVQNNSFDRICSGLRLRAYGLRTCRGVKGAYNQG